jgi:hypothetical protein
MIEGTQQRAAHTCIKARARVSERRALRAAASVRPPPQHQASAPIGTLVSALIFRLMSVDLLQYSVSYCLNSPDGSSMTVDFAAKRRICYAYKYNTMLVLSLIAEPCKVLTSVFNAE